MKAGRLRTRPRGWRGGFDTARRENLIGRAGLRGDIGRQRRLLCDAAPLEQR